MSESKPVNRTVEGHPSVKFKISSVFADLPEGTRLTIREIAERIEVEFPRSSAHSPTGKGAILATLTHGGVIPGVMADLDNEPKGAIKAGLSSEQPRARQPRTRVPQTQAIKSAAKSTRDAFLPAVDDVAKGSIELFGILVQEDWSPDNEKRDDVLERVAKLENALQLMEGLFMALQRVGAVNEYEMRAFVTQTRAGYRAVGQGELWLAATAPYVPSTKNKER